MVYGYIRVSTKHQSVERQRRNILELYPKALIVEEIYTGTKLDGRVKLNRLIKNVKAGDTVIFDSVSRMSRNAFEGIELYFSLIEKGVNLEFLKEPYINTSVYKEKLKEQKNLEVEDENLNGTIMAGVRVYLENLAREQIKIAFEQAEKEVMDTRQRIKEGISQAKLNGVKIGGVKGSKRVTEKERKAKKVIKKYAKEFGGRLNDRETLALMNGLDKEFSISKRTYYKYKEELRQEWIASEILKGCE